MRWQHDWMDALQCKAGAPPPGLRGDQDARRFEVYRVSHEANLAGALRDTYPIINRLVGEDFFKQAARAYLHAHPSRNADIHAFGMMFPAYLSGLETVKHLVYLADVARLEWLAHEAFHAAHAEAIDMARLADLPPESWTGLDLLPSVRMMHSEYPVHRIWQVNQENWAGDASVNLDEGGVHLSVFRDGLEIALLPLEAGAYALANAMHESGNLGDAIESMEDTSSLGRSLHALVSAGLVTVLPGVVASRPRRQIIEGRRT